MPPSILQSKVIDVSSWKLDDQFGSYPEGAREKSAFFPPEDLEFDFINAQKRYLFKRSRRMYPDQFWAEIVAYQVGCLLGVEVPPAFASYNSEDNTCGALIEWFYIDNEAYYAQGGNYMQSAIPNFERKLGAKHNYHTISAISRALNMTKILMVDWQIHWGQAFLFDALIGNTDRHQDNWGLIWVVNKVNGNIKVNYSPLFDNGTALGHELFEHKVSQWDEGRYSSYINNGCHHMKWNLDNLSRVGHVEMVKRVTQDNLVLKTHLANMLNNFSMDELHNTLSTLQNLELPIKFSEGRSNLMFKLISMRHQLLKSVLS